MRDINFRSLPKLRDSMSYLYFEHAKIDKSAQAIAVYDKDGVIEVPASSLTLLLLGPGTSITHEAIKVLGDSGCLTIWCGEHSVRYYAHGLGETRKGYKVERQAKLWADERTHMRVVIGMYQKRLGVNCKANMTLQQLRGMEGVRVRDSYAKASRRTGVKWEGRQYSRVAWNKSDDINRALSTANACLYGVCHSAIISAGYSPALGFIHSGKQLSFVYDIADLYKADITIPVAFETVRQGADRLETVVRQSCRDMFYKFRLLNRIIPDINELLDYGEKKISEVKSHQQNDGTDEWDEHGDPSKPLDYWEPGNKEVTDDCDNS